MGVRIWERLDRFLCNDSFHQLFERMDVCHLDWYFSNHRPIELLLVSIIFWFQRKLLDLLNLKRTGFFKWSA